MIAQNETLTNEKNELLPNGNYVLKIVNAKLQQDGRVTFYSKVVHEDKEKCKLVRWTPNASYPKHQENLQALVGERVVPSIEDALSMIDQRFIGTLKASRRENGKMNIIKVLQVLQGDESIFNSNTQVIRQEVALEGEQGAP